MADVSSQTDNNVARKSRRIIATWMIILGAGGVIFISAAAIFAAAFGASGTAAVIQQIYPALIGLFGSWVGTVLAFYFGQDNFEAANQQNRSIIHETNPFRHRSAGDTTPLSEIMISVSSLPKKIDTPESRAINLTISELDNLLPEGDSRLYILKIDGAIEYIVHRLVLDAYLRAKRNDTSFDPAMAKFSDFLGFGNFSSRVDSRVMAFLAETGTARDAKQALAANRNAWDVVVTATGTPNSMVKGVVTNTRLTEL